MKRLTSTQENGACFAKYKLTAITLNHKFVYQRLPTAYEHQSLGMAWTIPGATVCAHVYVYIYINLWYVYIYIHVTCEQPMSKNNIYKHVFPAHIYPDQFAKLHVVDPSRLEEVWLLAFTSPCAS